jgi:hypothetical protein
MRRLPPLGRLTTRAASAYTQRTPSNTRSGNSRYREQAIALVPRLFVMLTRNSIWQAVTYDATFVAHTVFRVATCISYIAKRHDANYFSFATKVKLRKLPPRIIASLSIVRFVMRQLANIPTFGDCPI